MKWRFAFLAISVLYILGSAFAVSCSEYNVSITGIVEYYNMQGRLIASGYILKNTGHLGIPYKDITIIIKDANGNTLSQTNGVPIAVTPTQIIYAKARIGKPYLLYVPNSPYSDANDDTTLDPGEQMVFLYAYESPRSPGQQVIAEIGWLPQCDVNGTPVRLAYEHPVTAENVGPMHRVTIWKNGGQGTVKMAPIVDARNVYVVTNEAHQPAAVGIKLAANYGNTAVDTRSVRIIVSTNGKAISLNWGNEKLNELVDVLRRETSPYTLYPATELSSGSVENGKITGIPVVVARIPELANASSATVTIETEIGKNTDSIFEYGSAKQTIPINMPRNTVGYGAYEVWPEEKLLSSSSSDIVKIDRVSVIPDAQGNVDKIIIEIKNAGNSVTLNPEDMRVDVEEGVGATIYERFDGTDIKAIPYDRFASEGNAGNIYLLTSYATNGTQIPPGHAATIGVVLKHPATPGEEIEIHVGFPYTAEAGVLATIPRQMNPNAEYQIYPKYAPVNGIHVNQRIIPGTTIEAGQRFQVCITANVTNSTISKMSCNIYTPGGHLLRAHELNMPYGGSACITEDPLPPGKYIVETVAKLSTGVEYAPNNTITVVPATRKNTYQAMVFTITNDNGKYSDGKYALILMATKDACSDVKWVSTGDENVSKNTCEGADIKFHANTDEFEIHAPGDCTLFKVSKTQIGGIDGQTCLYTVILGLKTPWKYGESKNIAIGLQNGSTIKINARYPSHRSDEVPLGNIIFAGKSESGDTGTWDRVIKIANAEWDNGNLDIKIIGNAPLLGIRISANNKDIYAIFPNTVYFPTTYGTGSMSTTLSIPKDLAETKPSSIMAASYFNVADTTTSIETVTEANNAISGGKPQVRVWISTNPSTPSENQQFKVCASVFVKNTKIVNTKVQIMNDSGKTVADLNMNVGKYGGTACTTVGPYPAGIYEADMQITYVNGNGTSTIPVARHIIVIQHATRSEKVAATVSRIAKRFQTIGEKLSSLATVFDELGLNNRAECIKAAANISMDEASKLNEEAQQITTNGASNSEIKEIIAEVKATVAKIKQQLAGC